MRPQYSLRTLIVVMTLGGPLLASAVSVAPKLARYLWSYKNVHTGGQVSSITWEQALAAAQQVQPIGPGFQTYEKGRDGDDTAELNHIHAP
jgi:hypothetical protein